MRRLLCVLTPLLLIVGAGCYSYVSVSPEVVSPGTQVRAQLGGEPAAARGFGLARHEVMEGEVVERRGESLVLSIIPRDLGMQTWSHGPRDTVAIRWVELEALEEKRLSAARTAGLVVGVGVVGTLVVRYLFGSWSGATTRPPGGGPSEVLLPR